MSSALGSLEHAAAQTAELAIGYGAGAAVQGILAPASMTIAKKAWSAAPVMPSEIGEVARLRLLGFMTPGQAAAEAALTGYDAEHAEHAFRALLSPPGVGDLLELLRRGTLSSAAARTGLERTGLHPDYLGPVLSLARVLLSPADLAMMRQQSFIDQAEQVRRSALQGVDAADAELLFDISGEPPGPEQMVALWRRGLATEDEVRQSVVEGRIKLKWVDKVLALRHVPLSAAVAAEAVLRERHLPRDPHYYAEAAGISHEDFDAWVDMMGRPPGPMEALTLVNRGVKGPPHGPEARAFFREVVARSDVRTEYADDLFELRIHYPSLFQIERLLTSGSITPELAGEALRKEGYPEAWVQALIHGGKSGKTAKHKELALGVIESLAFAGLETHEQALALIERLGYDADQAEDLLAVVGARRIVAEVIHSVGVTRAKYTGWKVDRPEAQRELDATLTDTSTRDRLLELWDGEREANRPQLTRAQIGQALKYGIISETDAVERWQRQGWSAEDAMVLAGIVEHGPVHAPLGT